MLQGAMAAEGKVGLMMNVRKADLPAVLKILPALQNPTISVAVRPGVGGGQHDHRREHRPAHRAAAEAGRRARHRRVSAEQDH